MPMQRLVLDDAPRPAGPYSHVAVVGNLVFTAGFGPQDPATGHIPDGIEAQTAAVLDNVSRALARAGSALQQCLKVTVHLAELDDFAAFNQVYGQYFEPPYPVRTTVGSTLMGILVEIDVVAVRTDG